MIRVLRQLAASCAVVLLGGIAFGSAIYSPVTSGTLPSITLTGDTTGVGAGGSIPTTTTKINGVTYVAPLVCATLTGTLGVDPQNTTTCASDTNTTIQTTCGGAGVGPAVHYSRLAQLWGTVSPFICTTTAVVFLSAHTDNSDPVVWTPVVKAGAVVSIQGAAPTVVATGVSLSGTVAKNRTAGSNSLLQENLGASGAINQLVENTTHSSRAYVYKLVSGTTFSMSQPMVKTTVPGTVTPAEVDTWADTDSVNLLTPIAVNVVRYEPVILDPSSNNVGYMYQLTAFDPAGAGTSALYLGNVRAYECVLQRAVYQTLSGFQLIGGLPFGLTLTNDMNLGGLFSPAGILKVFAGANKGAYEVSTGASTVFGKFDGDTIIGGAGLLYGSFDFGTVYLDGNVTMVGNKFRSVSINYGTHVFYGSGTNTINVDGTSRLVNATGTYVGSFTAPGLVTSLKLNGQTTACSHTNASPDVINCGIALTPTNIDAAAGASGFGGNAFILGGSSATNF